jgi:hypothetical protein
VTSLLNSTQALMKSAKLRNEIPFASWLTLNGLVCGARTSSGGTDPGIRVHGWEIAVCSIAKITKSILQDVVHKH